MLSAAGIHEKTLVVAHATSSGFGGPATVPTICISRTADQISRPPRRRRQLCHCHRVPSLTPTPRPRWLVPSRRPANPLAVKLPGSSWQRRLPASPPLQQEASRSHTGTVLAPLPSARSAATRSRRTSCSASSPFTALSVRLLRTSRMI